MPELKNLVKKISEEYAGKQVHLICVLKGGVFFMCELAKKDYSAGNNGLYECQQLW